MTRKTLIQIRRDSNADWGSTNPTLAVGEPGFETDTGVLKIGDGSTAYNNLQAVFRPDPYAIVGFKIDVSSSSPVCKNIDINKNEITLDSVFWDNHPIFSRIRTCVIDSDNIVTYGSNARGDGLTLDGTAGDVMVEFPKFYWAVEYYDDITYYWLSPYDYSGFSIHPWFVQRGQYESNMYLGAYGASFALDATTPKLYSKTGVNPVTGGVGYTDLPSDEFTIVNSETYANNKGTGWGSACWWSWHARMLLMYCEYGTRDLQTALGRGVVDLDSGTGYAGLANGADSIDTNIGTNGSGSGTGINGETPIAYRGVRDPYGNFWEFLTGWIAVDAGYQIVNRTGLASAVMPAGSFASADDYEQSTSAPTTSDGYISDYARDALLTGLFIPAAVSGSSSEYACDYFYAHNTGQNNILLGGGNWYNGDFAGPGYLAATRVSSDSDRTFGARLEYKPQEA